MRGKKGMATSLSFKLIQRRALYENRHRDTMINRCIQEIASLTKEITVKMVWLFALSGVLLASESMADDKEDVVGAILNFCDIESSLGNYEYRFPPFNEKIRSGAIGQ